MFIPEEKISEILNASDIIEVISDSVNLKKTGRNYVGLCPFHSEKTPSFSVSPQKQIFHCFGCSAGGNAISFLMKQHGISFPLAANMLAKRYGIVLQNREISIKDKQALEFKEGLYRVNTKVKEYYSTQLKLNPSAAMAKEYLEKRLITQETINEFSIGYALDKWDDVVFLLRKMKLSRNMAEQSGLVIKRKTGNGYYDRFRNRIMFPIFDANMQVLGFGGRVMDDALPKYLNSPETILYSKGKILYGFHAAKRHCYKNGSVYIVEGYFDFLSLYQMGIKNCVATLGTALTIEHIRLLKSCASKIFLVFDSDDAGVNAARRSVELFIKEGIELRIVVLPKGHDPDSFVKEYGAEAFESIAVNAMSAIEFLTEMAIKKYGLSIEGKVAILEDMKLHLAAIHDSTARSLYIRELAHRIGIDETAIIEKLKQGSVVKTVDSANISSANKINLASVNTVEKYIPREQQIISMMLQFPEIIDLVRKYNVLDFLYSPRLRTIGKLILNAKESLNANNSNSKSKAYYCSNSETYFNKTGTYANEGGSRFNDVHFYNNNISLVGNVMSYAQSETDIELIASLAMMEVADVDNVIEKSVFLIKRIIHVRKRNDSTLTHEIRRIEQSYKTKQIINTTNNLESEQSVKLEHDSDADLTLELLRQRQIEIRKLRGYE